MSRFPQAGFSSAERIVRTFGDYAIEIVAVLGESGSAEFYSFTTLMYDPNPDVEFVLIDDAGHRGSLQAAWHAGVVAGFWAQDEEETYLTESGEDLRDYILSIPEYKEAYETLQRYWLEEEPDSPFDASSKRPHVVGPGGRSDIFSGT